MPSLAMGTVLVDTVLADLVRALAVVRTSALVPDASALDGSALVQVVRISQEVAISGTAAGGLTASVRAGSGHPYTDTTFGSASEGYCGAATQRSLCFELISLME
jgi:hypothetical protein